mgnify:CR=1 FL=1
MPGMGAIKIYSWLAAIENPEDILSMYHIDIRILGVEYKDKTFTGRAICASRGIELYYNKRDHRFSSSDLRERVTTSFNKNG